MLVSKAFKLVQKEQRRKRVSRLFVLLASAQQERNPRSPCRLGVTVRRSVGSAVVRNRIKRVARESFRVLHVNGWDCVVIARQQAGSVDKASLRRDLDALFLSVLMR